MALAGNGRRSRDEHAGSLCAPRYVATADPGPVHPDLDISASWKDAHARRSKRSRPRAASIA